jgi:DNA-binding winged helix-turn-helix (wHTH) protein/Tol biopolymer transport system component
MRWQIEEFIFCERQQNLTLKGHVQQIEPMVVELLAFFCRNTDLIISRDQLIEQVWLGRVITDNAVSKVITKLRKYLHDDPKAPCFIATFPKKGYKFIATVELIKSEFNNSGSKKSDTSQTKQQALFRPKNNLLLISLLTVSLALAYLGLQFNSKHQVFTQVKALTRDPGTESKPQMSPDGQYLAYVERRDKKMRQWIKKLSDETSIEVSHGNAITTWVDSVSWNSDGSQFIYLVTTPDSCRYFIREFNKMIISEAKLIHNCPTGSYGKIAYTHDNNRVIYSENKGRGTAFTLFEMNLTTGVKRKLNQPEIFLGGNSQFDLHPSQNKLLISSPNRQQWEGFYSLDLDTDELNLLFEQDAFICCGRWSHDGKRVILMGEHPATQLVSYDLKGGDRRVIYTGSEQVRVAERHVNGKDYLFPLVQLNQNVNYFNFKTKNLSLIAHSSVNDLLATFAHHDHKLIAYISLSSGNEEIWLMDRKGKNRKRLTKFEDSRHYIELLWSYNGKKILAVTLNEIHLIDSHSGTSQVLKLPQVEIRGVSWKSDKTISYSVKEKDNWRMQDYNIETHQVTAEKNNWSYIRYTKNLSDTIWQDKDGNISVGAEPQLISDKELQQTDFVDGRTFNLKKLGQKWAWQERVKGKYQLMIKENLKTKQLLTSDSYHFQLSNQGVLFHTLESLKSDIYQTVSD